MDSAASTPSQKQPHWRHSGLTPEHPGQPQKGRSIDTKNDRGHQNQSPASTAQGQLAYTSCLSDPDWREPIPVHTNTLSAGSAATQQPILTRQSQPWMPHSHSNMTK